MQTPDQWRHDIQRMVFVEQWAESLLDTPCWITPGHPMPNGYCRLTIDGVRDYAHRQTYRLWVGPIPAGFEVDHRCNVPPCCNPDHLEAVPPIENKRRAGSRHRTTNPTCSKGHPREGNRDKWGHCIPCNVESCRRRYVPKERKPLPVEQRATHCKRAGHPLTPFDPENPEKYRGCMMCKAERRATDVVAEWPPPAAAAPAVTLDTPSGRPPA